MADDEKDVPSYEEKMEELHGLVTAVLLTELKKPEPSSQIISTAVRFLKDNGMTMDAEWSGDLSDLSEALGELPFTEGEVDVG